MTPSAGHTMQECKTCWKSKTAEWFVHPTTQRPGKTCADCITRRGCKDTQTVAALELQAAVDDHGRRLDDHGHRLATIESGTDVRADIAEWFALADPDEDVGPGDLVELLDGKISRATTGKGRLFVVSTAPRFTGNVPGPADVAHGRACAFMGQLPIKVRGAVVANQSLGPSGFDDGTAVATDAPTGIVALETSAADPADGFRLVNVLVNAGGSAPPADHAQRRWRKKQRQKQRRAAAADFVFVDESDAHSNALSDASTEDLASLASSHSCVARIVDEHAQLCVQVKMLSAALGGVRLLLRDPSARLAQRVTRGFIARRRCARRLDAVVTLQSSVRLVLGAALYRRARGAVVTVQGLARIRFARAICKRESESAAAVVIGAAARCYLVLVATPIGKLLSKTRRVQEENNKLKARLEAAEAASEASGKAHADLWVKLAAVPTTEATAVPDAVSIVVARGSRVGKKRVGKNTSVFSDLLYAMSQGALVASAVIARLIMDNQVKVDVHGSSNAINWSAHTTEETKNAYHRGTITRVDGKSFQVTFDKLYKVGGVNKGKASVHSGILASDFRVVA
ncbi:hypothetical protein M885DRAFT_614024 [Pelagophyceae sp. CCMP2097]|nr:hypothetical protein M885DRAFT_614024 [Pelagophyceae sp. CCMP2097]